MKKAKSFEDTSSLSTKIFLVIGILCLIIVIVMAVLPIDYRDITTTINGVRQPSMPRNVVFFKLIFCGVFGVVGVIFSIIGGKPYIQQFVANKKKEALASSGIKIIAKATGVKAIGIAINGQRSLCLKCAYVDPQKNVYVFKSNPLRDNPMPYLRNDQEVIVYHQHNNMSDYYVDVDGSILLGQQFFEM